MFEGAKLISTGAAMFALAGTVVGIESSSVL